MNNSITPRQMFFVVLQTQIGVGILSLPFTMFLKAKTDGWMSIMIAGIFVQFVILMMWTLMKRFPGKTLFEVIPQLIGPSAGNVLNCLYSIHFIFVSVLILMFFYQITGRWIFPETPKWVLMSSLALTSWYLIISSPRIIARFFIIVTPLLIVLFFLIAYAYTDVHLLYILPIGASGMKNVLLGTQDATVALLGFDSALVFWAYTSGKAEKKLKAVSLAALGVTLFYTYATFTTFIYFNPEEIIIVPEPVLYMLKAFSFKVIERTDLVFASLWLVSVATSFMSYSFIAAKGIQTVLKLKHHKKVLLYTIPACIFIATLPGSDLQIKQWGKWISLSGIIFNIPVIALLLLIAIFTKKKAGSVTHE
ncbi:GerAB/ArcD/ProY family transporter [Fictibacillus iocasae]|uniref:GerAB/ArcD/ProY family transporter n=1 Tax=Fictibacillus iocasae TaxID=2715437 RepID=A0ABW2NQS5_9BACL